MGIGIITKTWPLVNDQGGGPTRNRHLYQFTSIRFLSDINVNISINQRGHLYKNGIKSVPCSPKFNQSSPEWYKQIKSPSANQEEKKQSKAKQIIRIPKRIKGGPSHTKKRQPLLPWIPIPYAQSQKWRKNKRWLEKKKKEQTNPNVKSWRFVGKRHALSKSDRYKNGKG